MGVLFELGQLGSRAARTLATEASPGGVRRVALRAISPAADQTSGQGNVIGTVFNSLASFGKTLMGKVFEGIKQFAINFKSIFSLITKAIGFVWNFNWNVTDAALDAQLTSTYTAFSGALGGALGYTVGTLVCGVAPAALVATFNEPLALQILLDLGEESLEEIVDKFADVLKVTAKAITQTAAVFLYKNIRTILRPTNHIFRAHLVATGKMTTAQVEAAVAERDKPWSFASAFNEGIENLTGNEVIKEGIEEFFDEFADSCVENGYIIANTLDNFYPDMFRGLNTSLGLNTTVSISPTRA